MNIHKNARLTPYRREDLVTRATRGEPVAGLARQFGVSLRTARKWLARYRAEGVPGLRDRSSRPHASPRSTAPGPPTPELPVPRRPDRHLFHVEHAAGDERALV